MGTVSRNVTERIGLARSGHDVAMNLQILLWCPDIDPVATVNVGDEGVSVLDERRKVLPFDRPVCFVGNSVERDWFQDIDSSIDSVTGDLIARRFFKKSMNVPELIGFYKSIGGWIIHRCENDGRLSGAGAVKFDDLSEVCVRQDVTVKYENGILNVSSREFDRSAGSEW